MQPLRRRGLTGGAMVRRAYRQRTLIEVLLPDAEKLWDPTLRRIDSLLDDEGRVTQALSQRHPQRQRHGHARGRRAADARAQAPAGLEL